MSDREVVGCNVRITDQLVDIRQAGVAHNLTVAMILHHDDKYMVQMRHARRDRALGCGPRNGCCNTQNTQ